jgi:hypothetical protein
MFVLMLNKITISSQIFKFFQTFLTPTSRFKFHSDAKIQMFDASVKRHVKKNTVKKSVKMSTNISAIIPTKFVENLFA